MKNPEALSEIRFRKARHLLRKFLFSPRRSFLRKYLFIGALLALCLFMGISSFSSGLEEKREDLRQSTQGLSLLLGEIVQRYADVAEALRFSLQELFSQLPKSPVSPAAYPFWSFITPLQEGQLLGIRAPALSKDVGTEIPCIVSVATRGTLSPQILREMRILFSLEPLFRWGLATASECPWIYYLSREGWSMMEPYCPPEEFPLFAMFGKEFYTAGIPRNNPEKILRITSPYMDLAGKGPMVTLSAPIYEGEIFRGILGVDMLLSKLGNYLKNYGKGNTFLLDHEGNILAGNEPLPEDHLLLSRDIPLFSQFGETAAPKSFHAIQSSVPGTAWTLWVFISSPDLVLAALPKALPFMVLSFALFLLLFWQYHRDSQERAAARHREKQANLLSLLSSTLRSIPEGILVATQKGEVLLYNQIFPTLLERKNTDILRREETFLEKLRAKLKNPENAKALLRQSLEAPEKTFREILHLESGKILEATLLPHHKEGILHGRVWSIRDVTENVSREAAMKRAKEEAESANRAKSAFLANMSHEIRTPMNIILGMTELVLDMDLSPKEREYLENTRDAGKGLLGILNDLLDISKIEAGKMVLEKISFSAEGLFRELFSVMSLSAREKHLDFTAWLDPELPETLQGDPLRIGQILKNLLSNALKFTSRGSIALSVYPSAHEVVWEVRDTGIGISEEEKTRLFQKFSQADSSTTRKFGGTGLGLAISRELAHLMEGEIALESGPGGSTFRLHLPLEKGGSEKPGKKEFPHSVLLGEHRSERAFLVTSYLKAWGASVHLLAPGKNLHDPNLSPWPEILLLDEDFPQAPRIFEDFRNLSPENLGPPRGILFVSPSGEGSLVSHAEALPGFAVLEHPFAPSEFLDVLAQLFEKEKPREKKNLLLHEMERWHPLRGRSVLVAEDHRANRLLMRELLRPLQMEVTFAEDGMEALERVAEKDFDWVLMDVQMPRMDGLEAARRISRLLPDLPVIAMTAHAMREDREKSLRAGMKDHLTKPVEREKLYAALLRWLSPGKGHPKGKKTQESPQPPSPKSFEAFPPLPGIDLARCREVSGENPETCLSLLHLLREQLEETLRTLPKQEKEGNRKGMEEICHSLKGVAGNLGARETEDLAGAIVRKIRQNTSPSPEDLENLMNNMRDLAETLRKLPEASSETL